MKGFTGKLVDSAYPITDAECEKIHNAAVQVLERGGVRCECPWSTEIYRKGGCKIENDGKLVKIPEKVINECMARIPKSFTLYGRHDSDLDVEIRRGEVHFCTVTGRYIQDHRTGERRQATRKDAIEGTLIANNLENVHGLYKSVMWLYDEPMICNSQILVGEQMKNSNKTTTWVYNTGAEKEVEDLVKIWQIAAGGAEELRKKPHCLGHVIVNPPRVIDPDYTVWVKGFLDAGIPVTSYSAVMGGATAPATLAGMLVQVLVESLAMTVLVQLYKPGHPTTFNSFNPAMDMRTGLWAFGNGEYGIVGAGISRMAKYYGIPCTGFTITDSCEPDQQTAWEKAYKNFIYALSGVSYIWDIGGMAGFNFVTWPEMVLENEFAALLGHHLKGIEVDEERLSVEEIIKVGPLPGSYMKEKHTRQWYRKEFWMPELSNRDFFETWERGHTDLQDKALAKTNKILAEAKSPVAPEIRKEIDDFLDFVKRRDTGEPDKPVKM